MIGIPVSLVGPVYFQVCLLLASGSVSSQKTFLFARIGAEQFDAWKSFSKVGVLSGARNSRGRRLGKHIDDLRNPTHREAPVLITELTNKKNNNLILHLATLQTNIAGWQIPQQIFHGTYLAAEMFGWIFPSSYVHFYRAG